jgi:hypothetical protein
MNKSATIWEYKKYGLGPQMWLDTKADWLIVGHNITLTWISCSWELPSSKDMSMEAEEYSLLGAITKQQLVKT